MLSFKNLGARYEELRHDALIAPAFGASRPHGVALLHGRGMADWIDVWSKVGQPAETAGATTVRDHTTVGNIPVDIKDQLATLLAHVALQIRQKDTKC